MSIRTSVVKISSAPASLPVSGAGFRLRNAPGDLAAPWPVYVDVRDSRGVAVTRIVWPDEWTALADGATSAEARNYVRTAEYQLDVGKAREDLVLPAPAARGALLFSGYSNAGMIESGRLDTSPYRSILVWAVNWVGVMGGAGWLINVQGEPEVDPAPSSRGMFGLGPSGAKQVPAKAAPGGYQQDGIVWGPGVAAPTGLAAGAQFPSAFIPLPLPARVRVTAGMADTDVWLYVWGCL